MATATKPAKEVAVVTKDELLELAESEKEHAKAKKKAADAERDVKLRRYKLAEKVLGIKTEDELKALPPEKVEKLITKRLEAGDWKPERGAPEFTFKKSSHGTYPSWAKIYIAEHGQSAALAIVADTPVTYSYTVEVEVPA
jgi:hypothetical protein